MAAIETREMLKDELSPNGSCMSCKDCRNSPGGFGKAKDSLGEKGRTDIGVVGVSTPMRLVWFGAMTAGAGIDKYCDSGSSPEFVLEEDMVLATVNTDAL